MLPNFICPGTQKAGTTTLSFLLRQHPEIYIPAEKETHFFDRSYSRGIDWYKEKYFKDCKSAKIVGDITPDYMLVKEAPKRIYKGLGSEVKFVFMLRNPIYRAYSNYWMNWSRGFERRIFDDIVHGYGEKEEIYYIKRGFYCNQIERFLKYFPLQNMKFIIFEEFITDTIRATIDIFRFFEINDKIDLAEMPKFGGAKIPKYKKIVNLVRQSGISTIGKAIVPEEYHYLVNQFLRKTILKTTPEEYKRKELTNEIREILLDTYIKDIKSLEALIGRSVSIWY